MTENTSRNTNQHSARNAGPKTTGSTTRHAIGNRFGRGALAAALAVGALGLAAPAVAAPLAPAKPCKAGSYWEPHNKVCVPMSPPVRWH